MSVSGLVNGNISGVSAFKAAITHRQSYRDNGQPDRSRGRKGT